MKFTLEAGRGRRREEVSKARMDVFQELMNGSMKLMEIMQLMNG